MYFNRTTALLFCIVICTIATAQSKEAKIKFGDIKPEDFKPQVYEIDSSADAVYLYDIGSSKHEGNSQGWFSVVYKIHERIRLLHKISFDELATVKIALSKWSSDMEKIDDLQASTFNLDGGKVVETKVDKNSIFKDKDGEDQVIKFTFPNLKEGCIIEYSYTKTIPYHAHIPAFSFQGEYPELWSQFTIEVPEFFEFVVMSQGYLQPVIDTASSSSDVFNVLIPGGINASQVWNKKANTIRHTWAYQNAPAIKDESFITNLSNYVQRVEFQFSAERFPDEEPRLFMHSWGETVDELMKDEDFGADLSKENGWLKDDVKAAVKGETDPVNKARNIFAYVRDNYNCIDHSAVYLSQSLKKTQQLKKGNVSDINMLLIAMLRIAGFSADPVLLSTRGYGKTYDIYPIMDKFNYLIARVNINDDKSFLLDAADAILGFGHLSADCYNGNARVIAPNPVLISLDADSLREAQVTTFFLSNDKDGKMLGTYKSVKGPVESEDMREEMKKTDAEEYFKNIKKAYPMDVSMSNTGIDSLKQNEMPVSIQYDVAFNVEEDIIYFSPMMAADAQKQNPFKAAQRSYPVEMPYCTDETYILNMEVPAGYKVDELPKSARVSLNGTDGMFEYLIQQSEDRIQLRCRIKINKATFEPDDYETLRNFFAFIVEKEGEQIVFKKI